ncbi:MAG: hypothetical protein WA208_16735 [Thermoanaerobaculia bacterium]
MGWQFRNYVSGRGVDEIEEWEDTLPVAAQARLEWVLTVLKGVPRFARPYVGTRANFPDHYEIVVTSSGRELRPLGCYGPGKDKQFTLLVGAEEKGGRLEPRQADSIADARRKIVLTNPDRSRPRE